MLREGVIKKKKRWNFPSLGGWGGQRGVIFHQKKIAQNASNELKISLKATYFFPFLGGGGQLGPEVGHIGPEVGHN